MIKVKRLMYNEVLKEELNYLAIAFTQLSKSSKNKKVANKLDLQPLYNAANNSHLDKHTFGTYENQIANISKALLTLRYLGTKKNTHSNP